jgi:alkylhydroperoxidase family enzyme
VSIEPDASAGPAATAARRLFDAVLGSRGRADRARREAALQHGAAVTGAVREPRGEELGVAAGLVDKVGRHAYKVTEEDVALALREGYSEDEVFDLIVAAAVGAGMARRAIGRSAVERWERRR